MSHKPAIRVRTADGKPREWKEIHKALGGQTFVRVYPQSGNVEFIVTADSPTQLEGLREKLGAAGAVEIVGGNTNNAASAAPRTSDRSSRQGRHQQQGTAPRRDGNFQHGGQQRQSHGERDATAKTAAQSLRGKPYGFVAIPKDMTTAPPVWHDGTSSAGRVSGEVRLELETLTPLLVGWERGQVGDNDNDWPLTANLADVGPLANKKSVVCPLRAPWGKRPVVIPGDSLKGLLRHELGALLGAPMERVAERSYSYRPNAMYPLKPENRFLVPRLARVPVDGVGMMTLDGERHVRVPTRLELFPSDLEYNKKASIFDYRFDQKGGDGYRGGLGAGQNLDLKARVHTSLKLLRDVKTEAADVPQATQQGYLATVRHLVSLDHGHFSERHPDVPKSVEGETARSRILKAATNEVFQPGDLVWVEWDTEKKCIVSLGWHYYYRWAYADSVRRDADAQRFERQGLFPLEQERERDSAGAPNELSAVRRLFGYTGDNEGSEGIGNDDYSQLMGRVSVNAGLEIVKENEADGDRFLTPTFLKELGMPRPSAVEHYLQQPDYPRPKGRSDQGKLTTYGDAAGYDSPGELAGRKFYLDRKDAYGDDGKGLVPGLAADPSDTNRRNDRSTLALGASKPGRKFRFTVRFRDLDASELAVILVALCPNQFKSVLVGTHGAGYCSKLGYARPLGWGSVQIEAKAMLLLADLAGTPTLKPEAGLVDWVKKHHHKTEMQDDWLAIHRRNHPNADDYPRPKQSDKKGERNIYSYHTALRAEHSRNRRYKNGGAQ